MFVLPDRLRGRRRHWFDQVDHRLRGDCRLGLCLGAYVPGQLVERVRELSGISRGASGDRHIFKP